MIVRAIAVILVLELVACGYLFVQRAARPVPMLPEKTLMNPLFAERLRLDAPGRSAAGTGLLQSCGTLLSTGIKTDARESAGGEPHRLLPGANGPDCAKQRNLPGTE